MIKRFFAGIIRFIAIIAFIFGILAIGVGCTTNRAFLVPGIVVAIVSLIVNKAMLKQTDRQKTQCAGKCKKCGSSMAGARYEYKYDLSKATKSAYDGLMHMTVTISAYCPNCGKVKDIFEEIVFAGSSDISTIKSDVEDQILTLTEKYFGH